MKRAFVTGSEGFIGSHLCESLVARGYGVRALVLYNSFSSVGWLSELSPAVRKNVEVIFGDIRDPGQMHALMEDVDCVFHLAALIGIPYSYEAPLSYTQTNVLGTQNLLEGLKRNAGRIEAFVHTSTSEVYGSAQAVPMSEEHPINAQSPYAASKIGADMMALAYGKSFDLPVRVLRPFNTFGPRQSMRAITTTILAQIMSGKSTIKIGRTDPTRDLNYVTNTCDAFLAVAESSKCGGLTLNAGTGTEISVGALVDLCAGILGRKVSVESEPARTRPDKSEVLRLCADSTKLRELCGWSPKVDLRAGLEKTAQWLEKNLDKFDVEKYHV